MSDNGKLIIVRERLGEGTGDVEYQTADGRWWKSWDGQVRTGQDIEPGSEFTRQG